MFKFLTVLLTAVIHVQPYGRRSQSHYKPQPQKWKSPSHYKPQPQSDWFHDMGDDWEVSNKFTRVNPYYAWYENAAKQMARYGPAKHIGKINRGQFLNPELNMPADRAYGYQSDFDPSDFNSGAFKYKPQGQKYRASAVHVSEGLASFVGEVRTMPIGQLVQEDGSILVQTPYGRDPCKPNPCTNTQSTHQRCTAVNMVTAKCSSTTILTTVVRLSGTPEDDWNVGVDNPDAIDLTSSSNILMRGISLFGSLSGVYTHTGLIEVKETASQRILISENFEFTSTGNGDYFDHVFSSPATIRAFLKYTVTVEYDGRYGEEDDGNRIFYAYDGLESTTAACSNGETVTLEFDYSDYDNNGSDQYEGQIPRILISC